MAKIDDFKNRFTGDFGIVKTTKKTEKKKATPSKKNTKKSK